MTYGVTRLKAWPKSSPAAQPEPEGAATPPAPAAPEKPKRASRPRKAKAADTGG